MPIRRSYSTKFVTVNGAKVVSLSKKVVQSFSSPRILHISEYLNSQWRFIESQRDARILQSLSADAGCHQDVDPCEEASSNARDNRGRDSDSGPVIESERVADVVDSIGECRWWIQVHSVGARRNAATSRRPG